MANIKITDLTAYTDPAATDVLPIVDVGADVTKKVSIQDLLKNAGSGTANAPGIAFDGDNTGIYRPGADQLAISTNGTGRLFVDANGRVGVGGASASDLFEISKDVDGGVGPVLNLRNSTSLGGTGSGGEIRFNFRDTESNRYCVIGATNGSTFGRSGTIYFKTNSGTDSPTERLRITSAGGLNFVGAGTAGVTQAVSFNGSAPVDSLVIDSTGKVGVGTSSPGAQLEVHGSSTARFFGGSGSDATLAIGSTGASNDAVIIKYDNTADRLQFYNWGASASNQNTFVIDNANSRVGVGTTSPNHLLTLNTDSGACFMETAGAGYTPGTDSVYYGQDTAGRGYFWNRGNKDLLFATNNTERLRIDSSGNVGIGTSTVPTGLLLGNSLTVSSSTGAEIIAFRNDSATEDGDKCGAILIGNSDNGGTKDHFAGMWAKGEGASGGMDLHFAAGRGDYESDTPQFTILNDGTINASGDVGIGGTLPSAPNISLSSGGSADFAASVQVGGDAINGANDGVVIRHEGLIQLSRPTGANGLISGYTTGSSTPTFVIRAQGSAEFAGDLTIGDKIIHNGDTNTAVRFPANDTVSVETAGSERLRIDSSGNVGIGTTSPSNLLDVASAVGDGIRIGANTAGFITRETEGLRITAGSTNKDISFVTAGSEAMRVDTSGRLLVGTSIYAVNRTAAFRGTPTSDDNPGRISLLRKYSAISGNNIDAEIGRLCFADDNADGDGADIKGVIDGTSWSTTSKPTRLVFSTTASGSASPTERMRIESDGNIKFNAGTALYQPGGFGIYIGNTGLFSTDGSATLQDNTKNLGSASLRWAVVYAGTGTINTSDATLKQDIEQFEQAELNVATAIKGLIKKFRFADAVADKGNDARIHVGVIAQEVEQAFIAEGLNPRRYGLFCEDTLEDGSKRLGIRYDELLAFVIAAL